MPQRLHGAAHVGAVHPPGQGDVRQPPQVLNVAHLRPKVQHGARQLVGHVEYPYYRDATTAEDRDSRRPDLHRQQPRHQLRGALLVVRAERRRGQRRDVRAVGGPAVVELRGQAGVVQRLPVTAYDVSAGVVVQHLERVHARHAASLGRGLAIPGPPPAAVPLTPR